MQKTDFLISKANRSWWWSPGFGGMWDARRSLLRTTSSFNFLGMKKSTWRRLSIGTDYIISFLSIPTLKESPQRFDSFENFQGLMYNHGRDGWYKISGWFMPNSQTPTHRLRCSSLSSHSRLVSPLTQSSVKHVIKGWSLRRRCGTNLAALDGLVNQTHDHENITKIHCAHKELRRMCVAELSGYR